MGNSKEGVEHKKLIEQLYTAIKNHSDETSGHIGRISRLAGTLGQLINLPKQKIRQMREAAPLHDIGKIGIPDTILNKKDLLTGEEWTIMKQHTIKGNLLLMGSEDPILEMASQIALEHHERWDGTGYPHGKEGSEISLEARIVSIIDVFDALISKRCYKEAWSIDGAFNEIEKQRSLCFDPTITDAFLRNREVFRTLYLEAQYKKMQESHSFSL